MLNLYDRNGKVIKILQDTDKTKMETYTVENITITKNSEKTIVQEIKTFDGYQPYIINARMVGNISSWVNFGSLHYSSTNHSANILVRNLATTVDYVGSLLFYVLYVKI